MDGMTLNGDAFCFAFFLFFTYKRDLYQSKIDRKGG
jgi:hypothetical protein